eukprot:gene23756-biopygen2857
MPLGGESASPGPKIPSKLKKCAYGNEKVVLKVPTVLENSIGCALARACGARGKPTVSRTAEPSPRGRSRRARRSLPAPLPGIPALQCFWIEDFYRVACEWHVSGQSMDLSVDLSVACQWPASGPVSGLSVGLAVGHGARGKGALRFFRRLAKYRRGGWLSSLRT